MVVVMSVPFRPGSDLEKFPGAIETPAAAELGDRAR